MPSFTQTMMKRIISAFFVSVCLVFAANAQNSFPSSYEISNTAANAEIDSMLKRISHQKAFGLKQLDTGLLGDQFDITTGSVRFYRNIVSIPGNSSLPVSLGQVINDREGWIFDTPTISTNVFGRFGDTYTLREGALAGTRIDGDPRRDGGELWRIDRCSTPYSTWNITLVADKLIWHPLPTPFHNPHPHPGTLEPLLDLKQEQHSSIMTMMSSGGRSQALLISNAAEGGLIGEGGLSKTTTDSSAVYTTLDHWHISCIDDVDGGRGDGFKATNPQGHTYTFDRLFYKDRKLDVDERKLSNIDEGFEEHQVRTNGISIVEDFEQKKAMMKASKIEDIHGNWVKYEYHDNGDIKRIYSNDGREISVSRPYQGVRTISANGEEWSLDKHYLTLPDGTRWHDENSGNGLSGNAFLHTDVGNQGVCEARSWSASITHPSGAVATFTFAPVIQLYGGVRITIGTWLKNCRVSYRSSNRLKKRGALTYKLVRKDLSIANDTSYSWLYEYQTARMETDGIAGQEADKDGVATTSDLKWHKVTNPDGSVHRYWINRTRNRYKFGTVAKKEVYENAEAFDNNDISQTIDYVYNTKANSALGHAWPFSTMHANKPLLDKRIITMHNLDDTSRDTFTTEYKYNNEFYEDDFSYGKPVQISRYSDIDNTQWEQGSWPNGTGKIVEDITYTHRKAHWILGLPTSSTANGKRYNQWEYDDKAQLTHHKRFDALWKTYRYFEEGSLTGLLRESEDALGNITQLSSYHRGQARRITRADGEELLRSFDNNGWLKSTTDALGNSTSYKYNSIGWLKSIKPPAPASGIYITYQNKRYGGVIETVKGLPGGTKYTTYDGLLRPIKTEQSAIFQTTSYDYRHRVRFSSLPSFDDNETKGSTADYNAAGRMTLSKETVYPYTTTEYEYLDSNVVLSRLSSDDSQDEFETLTRRSAYGTPSDGAVLSINSPEGVTTQMEYNHHGLLKSLSQSGLYDGKTLSQTRSYLYDARDNLCSEWGAETGARLFDHDALDRVTYYQEGQPDRACINLGTTRKARSIEQTYTILGQLDKTLFPQAANGIAQTSDIDRDYDSRGNLVTLQRGATTWVYDFDARNLMYKETLSVDGLSFSTRYRHRSDGPLISITYPSGDEVDFAPDAFGRATEATRVGEQQYSYARDMKYHVTGALHTFNYGNGVAFTQTLNERYLPESREAHFIQNQSSPMHLTYQYDSRKNITHIENVLDTQRNVTNTYDGLNRLDSSKSDAWGGKFQFEYDPLGNLRKRSLRGSNYQTKVLFTGINGAKNRASGAIVDGKTAMYSYDTRGNVTSNAKQEFAYDYLNQPISISGNGESGGFVYDGNQKRVKQRTAAGDTIYSVYTSGAGLVSQYNKTQGIHTDYVRAGGTLVARVESKGSNADPATTAFNGTFPAEDTSLLWTEHYLPYGLGMSAPSEKSSALDFTGHVKDSSGLLYMQARYYDPVIGRFYSNDPVGAATFLSGGNIHGFNRYAYANNNPYKYIDPDGRSCTSADGTTTCTPESDEFEEFSFETPEGWEDFEAGDWDFHKYRFEDSGDGASIDNLKAELIKSPTNDSNAATSDGALNNVGPLIPGSGKDEVLSYTTTDGIVNVTMKNHVAGSGFVARKIGENGTIITYGEGNSLLQVMPTATSQAGAFWTKNAKVISDRANKK